MAGIGEQIRNARKANGMTQTELADKIFVTRSAVANWEQDRRIPDVDTLRKISEALGTNLFLDEKLMNEARQAGSSLDSPREGQENDSGPQSGDLNTVQTDPYIQIEYEGNTPNVPAGSAADEPREAASDSEQAAEQADEPHASASDSEQAAEQADEPRAAASDSEQTAEPAEPSTAAASTPAGRKRRALLLACGALCAALLIALVLPRVFKSETVKPYVNPEGQSYTIESVSQAAENVAGQAYFRVNPSLEVMHGETMDYYIYTFKFFETNGIALSVDRVEVVFFAKNNRDHLVFTNTQKDIQAQYGLETEIPAHGNFVWTGGLPVQDTVYGVAGLVYTTDENGTKQVFTSYIPFPEK